MTWTPSEHMTTAEELRRTLDRRAELGDDNLFAILSEMADAGLMWSYPPGVAGLTAKAKNLVEAVSSDDTGKLIGGQWVAGNGGLLSRATIAAADELRLELARWK